MDQKKNVTIRKDQHEEVATFFGTVSMLYEKLGTDVEQVYRVEEKCVWIVYKVDGKSLAAHRAESNVYNVRWKDIAQTLAERLGADDD